MRRSLIAWTVAAVGGLVLGAPAGVRAQSSSARPESVARVESLASGSISGVVHDERGTPVAGAMVSALGTTPAFTLTDRDGRFVLQTLSPGPYLVRAHLTGFVASRAQIVDVRPSGRTSSSIAMRHAASAATTPVLTAGVAVPAAVDAAPSDPAASAGETTPEENQTEVAWRLRHARRSILRDATVPADLLAANQSNADTPPVFGGAAGVPLRGAAGFANNVFASSPFSGQFNLLTTGSFDTPLQLFGSDTLANSVAYVSLGAAAGSNADWTVRGALSEGQIASWVIAGAYATRAPARHRFDVGVSYAAQRYEAATPAAFVAMVEAAREAGAMYGFDTFAVTPEVSVTYGARYALYDYLADASLLSPRVGVTIAPSGYHFRLSALVSRRALAPGAEEFLPPADSGVWVPPQRTFSSLIADRPLQAERTDHYEVGFEQDVARGITLSAHAFRQRVLDQMVTMFGVATPGHPASELAHYFAADGGDANVAGWSAGVRAAIGERVHGSLGYSMISAGWIRGADPAYLVLLAPSAARTDERIHDLTASFETDVPETSTRVMVLCRVSNGFARPQSNGPGVDSRFDVQVRQSLPFMNFSSAQWEALFAVRNFFHEVAPDQSFYDELLVVRPPKRVVGGLTLRF